MTTAILRDALVVSMSRTFWGDVPRSRHHVMRRLASSNDVLFVSRPLLTQEAIPRYAETGLKQVLPRLHTYVPPAFLPTLPGRPRANRILESMRAALLRRMIRRRSAAPPILYLWHPCFLPYLDLVPGALSCYHLFDDLALYDGGTNPWVPQMRELIARADVVIAVSERLAQKYGTIRPIHYCPNGVDFELFRSGGADDSGERELAAVPRPRLVLAGTLRQEIDIALLDFIASARPGWSLVLIGNTAANIRGQAAFQSLVARPNVHAIGPRPQHDVPALLAACNVALLPYLQGGAADFCSPLKLPEYLAVGLPVVSTPISAALEFAPVVSFAHDPPEWLARIEAALADVAPDASRRRVEAARNCSWDRRVEEIGTILQHAQEQRTAGAQRPKRLGPP